LIGYLSGASGASGGAHATVAFLQGLKAAGYVEGQNVKIEYRAAEGRYDRLPQFATELVAMRVAVLATMDGDVTARVAKTATSTIPIVFAVGGDPVQLRLVASLNRPGGNVTGATWFTGALAAKKLGLLRDLVPTSTTIAVLVNPDNARMAFETKDAQEAAHAIGLQFQILSASNEQGFEPAFDTLVEKHAAALLVVGDAFFFSRRAQLVALAARYTIPAIYSLPDFVAAGGLMSYGANTDDADRSAGTYVGRILKGEKPADLPVVLPTKFELSSTSRPLRRSALMSR
jgi:putative tryptophan/tyrosine transport system substrate-binding protein